MSQNTHSFKKNAFFWCLPNFVLGLFNSVERKVYRVPTDSNIADHPSRTIVDPLLSLAAKRDLNWI